ncbi:MAG: radical SAM protein [Chitinispirillaceae bacterium]|nr:radical SAM protein [Chitinispirillaceae bacterium]
MIARKTLYGSIIVTYRCNAHCNMCDCFRFPTRPEEEITLETIKKLPNMTFANITGGEPFIRKDIEEIVDIIRKKANRVVISSNGFFTDRIIELFRKRKDIGIRLSIEGLQVANDTIRGIKDGFDKGLRTLLTLVDMDIKDVGFGMTVQELNADDLLPLYNLSNHMGMELATATLHNSFYFRKTDNTIVHKEKIAKAFETLINKLLKSNSPKKWFRAYFNHGLINYIYGQPRLLPCDMGRNGFFVDPYGDVLPCNGMAEKMSMGNLNEKNFEEIWNSEKAADVRRAVKLCTRNCWMIGSAAPAMRDNILSPVKWIIKHKMTGRYSLSENPFISTPTE